MIEGKILVAKREDLKEVYRHKCLEDICVTDFSYGNMKDIHRADFILFVDVDNREVIFKNRWGKDGVIF